MAIRVVRPEEVLEMLMNDGTIDNIRMKIIAQLKANEDMKKNTMIMVEQSKVLNTPGAEKKTKRELFDALRQELETPVLEKASRAVWELILDNNGLGKEISETVEKAYCRLCGAEQSPLHVTGGARTVKREHSTDDSGAKDAEMDNLESPLKKRFLGRSGRSRGSANGSALDNGAASSLNLKT